MVGLFQKAPELKHSDRKYLNFKGDACFLYCGLVPDELGLLSL